MNKQILRNALGVSMIVGPLLIMVNNLDHFLAGTLPRFFILKAGLSFAVPFCVATYSSWSQLKRDEEQRPRRGPPVF